MNEIEYDSTTLKKILEQEKNFKIVLPNFQRAYVWKNEHQDNLLCSILAGVPIGSFLLLTGKYEDYASRPLCFDFHPENLTDECEYLLDGQQRLSTMKSMFSDLFSEEERKRFKVKEGDWETLFDKLPFKLRKRWFLKIDGNEKDEEDEEDEEDIFGYKNLEFEPDLHEPSNYEGYIKSYQVFKSTSEAYGPENNTEELITWSVGERLVPLWLLGNKEKTLRKILRGIAGPIDTGKDEGEEQDTVDQWVDDIFDFIRGLSKTEIATVNLPVGRIKVGISVFEQVNRGGTPLDIYDLIVARMARYEGKNENLTEQIKKIIDKKPSSVHNDLKHDAIESSLKWDPKWMGVWDGKNDTLSKHFRQFFKNCLPVSVLYSLDPKAFSDKFDSKIIKEKAVLDLLPADIYNNWKITVEKLLLVMQFLQFRCGIVAISDLPYALRVVPLFICCLKDKNPNFKKMEYWYWASLFSGHYREKQSHRIVGDSKGMLKSDSFEDMKRKVFDNAGYSDKDSLLRRGESRDNIFAPLDQAILQYVISKFPHDLRRGNNRKLIAAYKIANGTIRKTEHHIIPINVIAEEIPMKSEELRKKKEHPVNSPFNKMIISEQANIKIQRIDDYKESKEMQIEYDENFIPKPTEKKYRKKGKYDLDQFLSDRFDRIKESVENRLHRLEAK